jgi:hypothetical protein
MGGGGGGGRGGTEERQPTHLMPVKMDTRQACRPQNAWRGGGGNREYVSHR